MSAKGLLRYHLYQKLWTGLDWLFPPTCGGCGQVGSHWCSNCHTRADKINSEVCMICGRPQSLDKKCDHCHYFPPRYKSVRSWALFDGPVREAMHNLKYKRDIALGEIFSRYLIMIVRSIGWDIDIILPVPLGVARQAERGYNQAALLAFPTALGLDISYKPSALRKIRDTRTQVGLSISERRDNVSGAFYAEPKHIRGRNILVVDDVITSGATLDACAEALIEAGAKDIYGITVARAK